MTLQRIRVPAGFLFAIGFLFFCQPRQPWFALGTLLSVTGLFIRIWAAGHLEKFRRLAVDGPYRFTRNPLYLGSFIMGFGLTLAGSVWWLVVVFSLIFLLLYFPVMRREESELAQAYGTDFQRYRREVPIFWPGSPAASKSAPRRFSWDRVGANREYNAAAGLLILVAVLFIKMGGWI